ncbi:GbsR/MarR family transcriptional regulator [Xanthomarina gelatinilytica]|jgi:DNA-binding transcriptional regulator GbsR (MarR family)|uniref:GbsR/MarR family transcriptional regulator n=1 Tax=Xanthomarina gelatinilytica TaxID=1137281 RepID=UPI002BCEDA3B|nr:hypothetical protein [Xanthomarina sp.]
MENVLKIKKYQLVEKLGVHFEYTEKLAPVASRILAYIILTGKAGVIFEDLVSDLCASKSTISTHLNHLQDLNKITYFTKIGDRKKYFVINKDTTVQSIVKMIDDWENEKQLHFEIMAYKKEVNKTFKDEDKFDLGFHENYIEFLEGATSSINKLKENLINYKH